MIVSLLKSLDNFLLSPNTHPCTVIAIGFQTLEFFTMENGSARATVSVQINSGILEREVSAYFSTNLGGTASGSLTS